MTVFLDTNVLIYAVGDSDFESAKRETARALLGRSDCVLSVQVLQEFISNATRTNRGPQLEFEVAARYVEAWRRFPVQENTLALLDQGVRLTKQHRFAFWDSLIVAAALAQGCDTLYTEDMQDGRIIERLRIVNPFRP